MTYEEEGRLILKEYSRKQDELIEKYKENLKKLEADGAYETESSKLSREYHAKIKELKMKYNIK